MKHNKKIAGVLIFIICLMAMYNTSINKKDEAVSKTEFFMGTVVTITIYDKDKEYVLEEAFNMIKRVEEAISVNIENTEVNKLNNNAGKQEIKLSDISYEIIESALNYSRESNGQYDLTIGPLVELWSIGNEKAKVPTRDEIVKTKELVDYKKVRISEDTKSIFLEEENMKIDLGSIAKGYAADKVADIMRAEEVQRAIIDIGGNIYALGQKDEGERWTIGIQNPFDTRGEVVGSIGINNQSVVTSGIYERFIEEDGKKYHHILNPKTGYPYENDIAGVTIIADKSIDADALSTIVFTKGIEKGIKYIEEKENIEAIFISKDKDICLTSGLRKNFELLDNNFIIEDNYK